MVSIGDRVTIRVKVFLEVNGRTISNTLNESGFIVSFTVNGSPDLIEDGIRGMNAGDIVRIFVEQSEVCQFFFVVKLLVMERP